MTDDDDPVAPLQVSRHGELQPARAETAVEFVNGLAAIQEKMKGAPMCFDNPPIHVGRLARKAMKDQGIEFERQFHIPALSGSDFNKVVEHSHGRLKREMLQWYAMQLGDVSMNVVIEVLHKKFEAVNSPSTILKDVLTMKDTYAEVINNSGGVSRRAFR
jgi:hypothetical protein